MVSIICFLYLFLTTVDPLSLLFHFKYKLHLASYTIRPNALFELLDLSEHLKFQKLPLSIISTTVAHLLIHNYTRN
jgi:hypothetical protein